MSVLKARTEFASALNQVCNERGIEPEIVISTIEEAILAAYKRDFGMSEDLEYSAKIDSATGEAHLFSWAADNEKDTKKEVTPPGFGRIAAQVAKQVLLQKIREAEKTAVLKEYSARSGSLLNGTVLRFEGPNVVVDIGKTEAVMPPQDQVRSEKYHVNQRLLFFMVGIEDTPRGEQIILSRANTGLVQALFKREVPEVSSGAVQLREIAREPGSRTKIAVFSSQTGVDPVGSCVGQKGVRVQAVITELEGEKIDVIQYSDDPVKFITSALSPADKVQVKLDDQEKIAIVTVPNDQLSLAIGKSGQNVRLAAKLTGYKIDIKEDPATAPPATPDPVVPAAKPKSKPSKKPTKKAKTTKPVVPEVSAKTE